MKYKNKKVLVYGMSLSGKWVSKLLVRLSAKVFIYDDNINKLNTQTNKKTFVVQQINEDLIAHFDLIIVSPSISKDNEIISIAKLNSVPVFSEVEFASQFCKNIMAVTGTNGKTTTVQLISALLNKKKQAVACGNIGYPLSRAVIENKKALKVVEVSSFMLENCNTFSPHIATILNITPDHLVRHKTFEEYDNCKRSIFKNLTPKDYVIVNLDNKITTNLDCKTVTYSYNQIADACVKNGYIFLQDNKIIALNELKLKGKHNIYNILCAICFAFINKVKPSLIREALLEFELDNFRIEKVGEINHINFYNDSKSTNIASTLASVETIKGAIILLLGGSNKELDYCELFEKLSKRVKLVIAFGEIANELEKCNANKFKLEKCENLSLAFDLAVSLAQKKDNILLSPASASYDEFENYIARGKFFNNKVREYENKTKQE